MYSDLLGISTTNQVTRLKRVLWQCLFTGMLQRTSFQGVSLGEEHLATKDNNQTICCSTEAFLQNMASLSKTPQKQMRDSAIFTIPLNNFC